MSLVTRSIAVFGGLGIVVCFLVVYVWNIHFFCSKTIVMKFKIKDKVLDLGLAYTIEKAGDLEIYFRYGFNHSISFRCIEERDYYFDEMVKGIKNGVTFHEPKSFTIVLVSTTGRHVDDVFKGKNTLKVKSKDCYKYINIYDHIYAEIHEQGPRDVVFITIEKQKELIYDEFRSWELGESVIVDFLNKNKWKS